MDCEHSELCSLSSSSGRWTNKIQDWLKRAFENALRLSVSEPIPGKSFFYDFCASIPLKTLLMFIDVLVEAKIEASVNQMTSRMTSQMHLSAGSSSLHRTHSETTNISNAPAPGSSIAQGYDILPIVNKFHTTMKPAQLPCFMVENRLYNREFFGQEDILKRLDEVLLPSLDLSSRPSSSGFPRPTHLTLYGQGGLGKSEIAIHFVFARRQRFDAVFWVRADDAGKLEEGRLTDCSILRHLYGFPFLC